MNIDEISKQLNKFKRPPEYDENGDPCYKLLFFGTKEEYEALKRDLSEVANIHE